MRRSVLRLSVALVVLAALVLAASGLGQVSSPVAAVVVGVNGRIAFQSERDGNAEIYVMGGNGASPTRLTNSPKTDGDPGWSPDGAKIAFHSSRDGGNLEIYGMDANGGNPTRLTNNAAADGSPAWSPDGTRITFAAAAMGLTRVFRMAADGSQRRRSTKIGGFDEFPDWQAKP